MQNARRAHKIRLCGHLRRYKKIVKKTYIIYYKNYIEIHPNALATELIRIMAAKIGHRYWIIK